MQFKQLIGSILVAGFGSSALAAVGTAPSPTDLIGIQNAITQYCISVDTKDYSSLSKGFDQNIVAIFDGGAPTHGLDVFIQAAQKTIGNLASVHMLGTQVVEMVDGSTTEATAKTYVQSTVFQQNNGTASMALGPLFQNLGYYEDKLRSENGVWLIYERNATAVGTTAGSPSILGAKLGR